MFKFKNCFFVSLVLIILTLCLAGCAGLKISGDVFFHQTDTDFPLQNLVIRNINLSDYHAPMSSAFMMEDALRHELMMSGAQFRPDGVTLTGEVRVIKNRRRPCQAILLVRVESFGSARLCSSASVRVGCVNGRALIYHHDYQRAAQFIVNDFIWQMRR